MFWVRIARPGWCDAALGFSHTGCQDELHARATHDALVKLAQGSPLSHTSENILIPRMLSLMTFL